MAAESRKEKVEKKKGLKWKMENKKRRYGSNMGFKNRRLL